MAWYDCSARHPSSGSNDDIQGRLCWGNRCLIVFPIQMPPITSICLPRPAGSTPGRGPCHDVVGGLRPGSASSSHAAHRPGEDLFVFIRPEYRGSRGLLLYTLDGWAGPDQPMTVTYRDMATWDTVNIVIHLPEILQLSWYICLRYCNYRDTSAWDTVTIVILLPETLQLSWYPS